MNEQVRPFPWGALDRTRRADANALRDLRGWVARVAAEDRLGAAASEVLAASVSVRLRRVERLVAPRGLPGGAGVLVALAETPETPRAALVAVDAALAAAVVRRAVRRPTALPIAPGAELPAPVLGAFAAALSAALRRAHRGVALRVLAAGPAPALEADLARSSGGDLVAVSLTVLLADDAFEARVVAPRAALPAAPPPRWGGAALTAMGATPLAVPIVAWAATVAATEVAQLEVGDVLVLGGFGPARTAGGLTGPVVLAAEAAEAGVLADLGPEGRLVLRGGTRPLDGAGADMGDHESRDLLEAVGDVPVLVRAEIGEARMAARDWAALAPGDVLSLGRRIGERVVLRVGGIAVASGDLVEIDGEVGVRIVERLTGGERAS